MATRYFVPSAEGHRAPYKVEDPVELKKLLDDRMADARASLKEIDAAHDGHMTAVTHNGTFHPDDVLSAVVLEKIYPGIEIIRSRDPDVIARGDIVFDVGREYDPSRLRFDHHQEGAPVRANGIAYSAFGLLWLEYGEEYCGDAEVAEAVDRRLVQVIDANDNGTQLRQLTMKDVEPYEVFDILFNYNPRFGSDETYDEQYRRAVVMAKSVLELLVDVEYSHKLLREYFETEYAKSKDTRYVVLEKGGNYKEVARKHEEMLYFVSPDEANQTWGVTAVSQPDDIFALRKALPESWSGKMGQAFADITGVSDAQFCHLKRFLAVAKSKEGALELLAQALQ